MESKPDVFDPNEKVEKPFAGLGPDVGQAAMLRLTAKHRGIEDAVRLARRDQSIEYTVADAKTHTFRSDHDELRMTYLSDGSPYKPEHTIITANGIKPASVMSWIHREKPGSPEWEQRARQRFIILFTCYTEYVHIEMKEETMKSYKTYAEEYGLDIEVVRWVFNHIRVTRYVMSEPIGYKIAFKYLGQPVHLSSNWKTGVAEKSFREIVNIRRKAITTEANPELVPDKD